MNPEIFVTSFNELVHHLTSTPIVVWIAFTSLTWTFLWAMDESRCHFSRARRYYQIKRDMCQFPRAFLISGLVVFVLDYLVLVFLNLMGW